jgi:hypothetical protein
MRCKAVNDQPAQCLTAKLLIRVLRTELPRPPSAMGINIGSEMPELGARSIKICAGTPQLRRGSGRYARFLG